MNISLPAPLKSWVEEQVAARGYSTASEFVRDVLRREQTAAARARVDEHLREALNSGPARPLTRKVWDNIRTEGMKLARGRGTNK